MSVQEVVVYISDNSLQCEKLINEFNKWEIHYKTKNVTENRAYLEQLQERGIFGTPVTFVDEDVILGFQINRIKHKLGMLDHYQSYRSFNKT